MLARSEASPGPLRRPAPIDAPSRARRRAGRRRERGNDDPPPWFQLPSAGSDDGPVAILGAGLAGCWLAHELAARGRAVVLIDRHDAVGRGASGNPVGVVKPFVTREHSLAEGFHTAAFAHLLERLVQHDLAARARFSPIGVLQLIERAYEARTDLVSLDSAGSSARAGMALGSAALAFERGGWLDPSALCRALTDVDGGSRNSHVAPIDVRIGCGVSPQEASSGLWKLRFDDGRSLDVSSLVLATGSLIDTTHWTSHLPVTPARGQLDRFERGAIARSRTVLTGSSWLIPDGDTVWAGATYARDSHDAHANATDTDTNRGALESLAGAAPGAPLHARAGIRATLPDRLPLVGPVVAREEIQARYADLSRGKPAASYDSPSSIPGLALLGGFGSRGIVTTALSASLLADWICGDTRGLQAWYPLLAPHRFMIRDALRARQ